MKRTRFVLIAALIALATGLLLPASSNAAGWGEVKKLTRVEASSNFGESAGISGDHALVGAPNHAYIFRRDQGGASNWGEVKDLQPSDPGSLLFGIRVAISGDTAVVGAYLADSLTGYAYVFQRDAGGTDNWGEVKKLTASDAGPSQAFGASVAIDGDTVIVGGGNEAAYVFERDAGGADNWGEVKKVTASDGQGGDAFGFSVSLSGDSAVVGGPFGGAGAAYVFERDAGGADNWGEVKKLTASDGAGGDQLGYSVSLSGDSVVAGAYGADGVTGAAYVYSRDQGGAGNWGDVKKVTASDGDSGDAFGYSAAISGDRVVVGAYGDDADAGAAYVFERNQGGVNNWGEVTKLTAADAEGGDQFGSSTAVHGDYAVVGANQADDLGLQSGSAYIFSSGMEDPDQDGCTSKREAGPNPALGGGRNYQSFWDFFDAPTPPTFTRNQVVNVGDIAAVVARFGAARPGGAPDKATALAEALAAPPPPPTYHAGYDRTPAGMLTGPPDGAITVVDINRAVAQFGHSCL